MTTLEETISLSNLARFLVDQGVVVLPTTGFLKHPSQKGWNEADKNTAWDTWNEPDPGQPEPTGGAAVARTFPPDLVCFDVDIYDPDRSKAALDELGLTGQGVHVKTVSGGYHVWARWPDRPALLAEHKLPSGGTIETRSCDRSGLIMLPLSRADSNKGDAVRRGSYTCEDPSVFLNLDAFPVLSESAISRLAPRFTDQAANSQPQSGPSDGIAQLKKALMGFLEVQTFQMLTPKLYGRGSRTDFFFPVGHTVGSHAWHPMPVTDLADIMFDLVADSGYVDWSDDHDGQKREDALKQFIAGIACGRDYAAKGKDHAVKRALDSLGATGKKAATDEDVEAAFRSAFGGPAHIRVEKSGVKVTGFTFYLLPGSTGFHLADSQLSEKGVRVVQLPLMTNKGELFCEIIRTLGLDSAAAHDFLSSPKAFPRKAWQLLYTKGSTFQTQVDWKAELASMTQDILKGHDEAKYEERCEQLDKGERSRLWYHLAPRTEDTDVPRVIKDKPWISGIDYTSRESLRLFASKEWWDQFRQDQTGIDGIEQWWTDHSVAHTHRNRWEVVSIPLFEILDADQEEK